MANSSMVCRQAKESNGGGGVVVRRSYSRRRVLIHVQLLLKDFDRVLDVALNELFHEEKIFGTEMDAIVKELDVLLANAA